MCLAGVHPASAHRLDEYLQATTVDLAREGVTLRLRLTPGVDVAGRVIPQIDRNGDGVISAEEQQAYAGRIAQSLSVTLNGKSVSLRAESGSFPTRSAIKGGEGVIALQFSVSGVLQKGTYHLAYTNHGAGPDTVYLVNCLQPQDQGVQVQGQKRSTDQASYQLDFTVMQ
ncbi:EF-hand domain-containing protein [Acetobacter lambici]|uniref:EF-hand domain-containing protein n=1 Tax=Acetobacter lambici TaxID=1332824 RepID=A0ABT1F4I1_9PROT|nr:EF-hand domain-containing protein [Acetobacter lambici]MCP1244091.1 hypothetical protein [Acetobacter lambici]MCP1260115.1 hypothetical protein [Acetobacter lambici]